MIFFAVALLSTNSSKVIPVVAFETKSAGPVKPPYLGYSFSHTFSCASVGQVNVVAKLSMPLTLKNSRVRKDSIAIVPIMIDRV
jgi:hypothetical protein